MHCTMKCKEIRTSLKCIGFNCKCIFPIGILISKKCCLGLAKEHILKALASLKSISTNKAYRISKFHPLQIRTIAKCIGINSLHSSICNDYLINNIAYIFKTSICNFYNCITANGFWHYYRKGKSCWMILCISRQTGRLCICVKNVNGCNIVVTAFLANTNFHMLFAICTYVHIWNYTWFAIIAQVSRHCIPSTASR